MAAFAFLAWARTGTHPAAVIRFHAQNFFRPLCKKSLGKLYAQLLGFRARPGDFPSDQPFSLRISHHSRQPYLVSIRPCSRPDRDVTAATESPQKGSLGQDLGGRARVVKKRDDLKHRIVLPSLQSQSPLGNRAQANVGREILGNPRFLPEPPETRRSHDQSAHLPAIQLLQSRIDVPANGDHDEIRPEMENLRLPTQTPRADLRSRE